MSNPCFNDKEQTDCPRRTEFCKLECEDWKAHEAKRNKGYKDKLKQNSFIGYLSDQICKQRQKEMKRGNLYGNTKND